MRRQERKITDPEIMSGIISRSHAAHVAFIHGGAPAIVPITFGCELVDGAFTFYFHGAREGNKIDAWRADPRVAIEITGQDEVVCGTPSCHSTTKYASVIAEGKIEFITDPGEKRHALDIIMNHCGCTGPHEYPDKMLEMTAVLKVRAETICGKSNFLEHSGQGT